jgi:hypothetical protein
MSDGLLAGGDEFGRSSTARRRIIGERPPSLQAESADGKTEDIIKEINNLQMPQEIWPI